MPAEVSEPTSLVLEIEGKTTRGGRREGRTPRDNEPSKKVEAKKTCGKQNKIDFNYYDSILKE